MLRGSACPHRYEFIPQPSYQRFTPVLQRFDQSLSSGDFTLAENQALMMQRNAERDNEHRFALLMLGMTQFAQGQYRAALDHLKSLQLGQGLTDTVAVTLWWRALAAYAVGDWVEFESVCERHGCSALVTGCVCKHQMRLFFLRGLKTMRAGELEQAHQAFSKALPYEHLFPHLANWARLGVIETLLRSKRAMEAYRAMREFDAELANDPSKVIPGWRAIFTQTAQETQRYNFHWDAPDRPQTGPLIRQVYPETAAYRVEVFGPGKLFRNDHEILPLRERPNGRVLLAYLALNPKGVSGQDILRDLWPEYLDQDEPDVLSNVFPLAKEWRIQDLITYDQGIYTIRPDVWVDATEFIARYNATQNELTIERLNTAQKIYRAPFLHGLSGLWVEEMRARFQLTYSFILWQMAALEVSQGQFHEAQRLLEESVDNDYTFDRGMIDLMRLLERMDLRGEALRRYVSYQRRLEAVYRNQQITPSPELAKLAKRMREDENQVTGPFDVRELQRAVRATMPVLPAHSDD